MTNALEEKYGLGLIGPDPIDERDLLLSNFIEEVPLPEVFSLTQYMTEHDQQAKFGACAAFAGIGSQEYKDKKELGIDVQLSAQDLYGKAKMKDGYGGEGTTLRAIVESMYKEGICEEIYFPYEARYPPLKQAKLGAVENALTHRIANYASVDKTIDAVTQAVYTTGPVLGGFWVFKGIYEIGSDGIIPMPTAQETQIGGHAMDVVGFDFKRKMLELRNSWGLYGDKGNLWMSFDVFYRSAMDFWSTTDLVKQLTNWSDWDINDVNSVNAAKLVYDKKLFEGYKDGTFRLYNPMYKRHVYLVAQRLQIILDKSLETDYNDALRGWVRDNIPGLRWEGNSQGDYMWGKTVNRYQMCMLIARYIVDNGL